jgi:FkbM family methyltransferase
MRIVKGLLVFVIGVSVGWNLTGTFERPQSHAPPSIAWFNDILIGGDIWDGIAPLGSAARPCRWKNVNVGSISNVEMCLDIEEHNHEISLGCEEACKVARNLEDGIYVNIGSSSGLCLMRILLESSMNVIAVEPHPVKLFHLTSTILKLDVRLRERIIVLPIAAGDRENSAFLFSGDRNYGDDVDDIFRNEAVEVPIHRLDRVMWLSRTRIGLIHIDTGGGRECGILQALSDSSIDAIVLETHAPAKNNCTELNLINSVRDLGFSLNIRKDCRRWTKKLVCSAIARIK